MASVFAPVSDGEASLAPVLEADPGQEVRGDVLRLDPRTGAHFGFASLVEGHVPLASGAAVPVEERGVGVVAVLLEALPELAVVGEPLLEQRHSEKETLPSHQPRFSRASAAFPALDLDLGFGRVPADLCPRRLFSSWRPLP